MIAESQHETLSVELGLYLREDLILFTMAVLGHNELKDNARSKSGY